MVEIEDRGLTFKSYKSYAKFLELEVKQLQQLLPSDDVGRAFYGARRDAAYKKIPMNFGEGNPLRWMS